MSLKTSKLGDLCDLGVPADLDALLSSFKCSRNPDSEKFLRKIAVRHESKDISRTYLCMDAERPNILGYFTLAVKCISMDASRNADADMIESMNVDHGVAQAYLIGQLARADDSPKGFGRAMVEIALAILSNMNETVGCHTVRIDCEDELTGYYSGYGFVNVGKNVRNNQNHMVAVI